MVKRTMDMCFCHSGKQFTACCDRFLNKGGVAKTPEQLMRSRYTAYALGGFGEYLLSTWAPEKAVGLSADSLSEKNVGWCRLEIVDKSQSGNNGVVEFKAFFIDNENKESVLHERSRFERRNGKWLYMDGELFE